MANPNIPGLAETIAARLSAIDGVEAVVLGGSWARGTAKPNSDIDLALYYDPARPPDLAALRSLAQKLDDEHRAEVLTDFGGWGKWINGGGWLKVQNTPVDWLYRNLDEVRQTLDDCHAGRITTDLNPGHPHGFHNYIYLGETHFCVPLFDRRGRLAELKELAQTYPPKLKEAIITSNLWQAGFALQISRKSVGRGESSYVAGCFYRCVACLVQAVFARNEEFFMNEKGAVAVASTLPLCPPDFEETIENVMTRPGDRPAELERNLERLEGLVKAVETLGQV